MIEWEDQGRRNGKFLGVPAPICRQIKPIALAEKLKHRSQILQRCSECIKTKVPTGMLNKTPLTSTNSVLQICQQAECLLQIC